MYHLVPVKQLTEQHEPFEVKFRYVCVVFFLSWIGSLMLLKDTCQEFLPAIFSFFSSLCVPYRTE